MIYEYINRILLRLPTIQRLHWMCGSYKMASAYDVDAHAPVIMVQLLVVRYKVIGGII